MPTDVTEATGRHAFGTVNFAVLGVYLLGMLALGWWCSRRVKTARSFFVADGRLNWLVVGLSLLGTYLSALTMMALSVGSIILGFASGTLVQRMQPRTLMQIFLGVVAVGMVWLFFTVSLNVTLGQLILPMFVVGHGGINHIIYKHILLKITI